MLLILFNTTIIGSRRRPIDDWSLTDLKLLTKRQYKRLVIKPERYRHSPRMLSHWSARYFLVEEGDVYFVDWFELLALLSDAIYFVALHCSAEKFLILARFIFHCSPSARQRCRGPPASRLALNIRGRFIADARSSYHAGRWSHWTHSPRHGRLPRPRFRPHDAKACLALFNTTFDTFSPVAYHLSKGECVLACNG